MSALFHSEWLDTAGWLALRVGYGFLFLNAAWACGKDAAARQWTVDETRILISKHTELFAYSGIAIMGAGGASLLFGLLGPLGALALFIFLLPGAVLHFRQAKRAEALFAVIRSHTDYAGPETQILPVMARLGHYSSALKNLALATGALFFVCKGTGPWSLDALLPLPSWWPR